MKRTMVPMIVPVEGGGFEVWSVAVDDHLTQETTFNPDRQTWTVKYTTKWPIYRGDPVKR